MTELAAAGYDASLGVDRSFVDQASGEKSIVGLETLASQFAMLDGHSLAVQELMLKDSCCASTLWSRAPASCSRRGRAATRPSSSAQIFQPVDEAPELESYYDAFFWQRNASMTARLVELAGDGQTRFVVLGAGHMLGAKGIPALLAQQGFVVERVAPRREIRSTRDSAAPPPCS